MNVLIDTCEFGIPVIAQYNAILKTLHCSTSGGINRGND